MSDLAFYFVVAIFVAVALFVAAAMMFRDVDHRLGELEQRVNGLPTKNVFVRRAMKLEKRLRKAMRP